MTVIGLTGRNGAGKGEVAEILKNRGFHYASLSDVLRAELQTRGDQVSRMNLVRVGRELRALYGPSILACRIGASLDSAERHVIDSIRNPAEVRWLQNNVPGFALWNVTASATIRFYRIRQRKRESDPQTLEQFLELEELEANAIDSSGQDMVGTAELADIDVPNETTLEDLVAHVDKLLGKA